MVSIGNSLNDWIFSLKKIVLTIQTEFFLVRGIKSVDVSLFFFQFDYHVPNPYN